MVDCVSLVNLLRVHQTNQFSKEGKRYAYLEEIKCQMVRYSNHFGRALTPLFGDGAGAHGIGKISGVLTKIGKFVIVLMYDVSIAKLIPIIKLTFFLDI